MFCSAYTEPRNGIEYLKKPPLTPPKEGESEDKRIRNDEKTKAVSLSLSKTIILNVSIHRLRQAQTDNPINLISREARK